MLGGDTNVSIIGIGLLAAIDAMCVSRPFTNTYTDAVVVAWKLAVGAGSIDYKISEGKDGSGDYKGYS